MHVNGKINDKYPIFNDLICFMWCKMKLCAKDVLLIILKQFYKSEEIMKARDLVYEEFPVTTEDGGERRVKHRRAEEALSAIYNILQNLPVEDPPVVAALNLNNIPYVELKNVDGAAIMWQQGQLKDQLHEMTEEQTAIKVQLANIMEHLTSMKNKEEPKTTVSEEVPGGEANSFRGAVMKNLPHQAKKPPLASKTNDTVSSAGHRHEPPRAPGGRVSATGPRGGSNTQQQQGGAAQRFRNRVDSSGRGARGEGSSSPRGRAERRPDAHPREEQETRRSPTPRGFRRGEDGYFQRIQRPPPPVGS